MGPPFTNLFASCCTSPSFVFGARFATPRMALGPICRGPHQHWFTHKREHVPMVMLHDQMTGYR